MKKVLLAVFLIFYCTLAVAEPDWYLLSTSKEGDKHYVEVSTLKWDAKFNIQAIIKVELKQPQTIAKFSTSTYIFDYLIRCGNMSASVENQYFIVDGSDTVITTPPNKNKHTFIKQSIFDMICVEVKYFEKNSKKRPTPIPSSPPPRGLMVI